MPAEDTSMRQGTKALQFVNCDRPSHIIICYCWTSQSCRFEIAPEPQPRSESDLHVSCRNLLHDHFPGTLFQGKKKARAQNPGAFCLDGHSTP